MALGIVGLPIPDETILTFAGFLVYKKDLMLIPVIISSFLGSISGISISYLLGRTLGIKVITKAGRIFHITEKNLEKTRKWFEGYGSWVLFFGYFIPGIRHLTALTAGTTKTDYHKFAAFAYSGALVWSSTFILIGYYTGKNWMILLEQIRKHILAISLIIIFALIMYFLFKKFWDRKKNKRK
jgi:membrane protein DedA with SNARE-associated domain